MKSKDVRLGVEYAIKYRIPGGAGMPAVAPVIHATCVDIAESSIVLEYEDLVPKAGEKARAAKTCTGLIGNRNYVPGKCRIRVPAIHVICRYDEWQPSGPGGFHDGRMDGPITTRAAGETFSAWPMPLPV